MNKIILYTSDTCQRCTMVKLLLNSHNIDYEEVVDRDYILNLGLESVPAIHIGDTIIDNYIGVLNWLDENGYYSLEVNENENN